MVTLEWLLGRLNAYDRSGPIKINVELSTRDYLAKSS